MFDSDPGSEHDETEQSPASTWLPDLLTSDDEDSDESVICLGAGGGGDGSLDAFGGVRGALAAGEGGGVGHGAPEGVAGMPRAGGHEVPEGVPGLPRAGGHEVPQGVAVLPGDGGHEVPAEGVAGLPGDGGHEDPEPGDGHAGGHQDVGPPRMTNAVVLGKFSPINTTR